MMSLNERQNRMARIAQGPVTDLALHTLGWKSFQDLCAHICQEILQRPVEIYREAQDGGQDAVFLSKATDDGESAPATIQCKFSSKADRTLKIGDINTELENIEELLKAGNASTYVFMTNMSVDAPVSIEIKAKLRSLGVWHPHVFGKQFITQAIKTNARLRALIPRVYGLGDLSVILDERVAEQTKALLGHMLPTLKVYVPTEPHVNAVHKLADHGIVLLLGDPATGKSSIAAILSTTAAEQHDCYKTDGPLELPANWNPHEGGKLFWVDDAFGPNQMREDYVDHWINIMPKVQAAIANGNRFILTSRRHIYNAAAQKLGSRNHPLLKNGKAVVNVGTLTPDERRQILYNHIRLGGQTQAWKSRVKPQLEALANEPSFLPENARRLGDPAYTTNISTANDDLLAFIRSPKEHLIETIHELSALNQAALTLVFLHRGYMPTGDIDPIMNDLAVQHYGVDASSLGNALSQLLGSFVVQKIENGVQYWTFKHPTIADALSSILGETEGMAQLYLYGTKSETIVSEAVCANAPNVIPDAIHIPEHLDDLLAERLLELPDEPGLNRSLFYFLDERASDSVFKSIAGKHSSILGRKAHMSWRNSYDPKVRTHARAYKFGMLPTDIRAQTEDRLIRDLIEDFDASILNDNAVLALIQPLTLLYLHKQIKEELLPNIVTQAEHIVENGDLDIDPEENFSELTEAIETIRDLFDDDETSTLIEDTEVDVSYYIQKMQDKKKEQEQGEYPDDWEWERYRPSSSQTKTTSRSFASETQPRSIFSDVDK